MQSTPQSDSGGSVAVLVPEPDAVPGNPPWLEFGERLVRLNNGRHGLRGGLAVRIELPGCNPGALPVSDPLAAHPGAGAAGTPDSHGQERPAAIIDFIASSETLDRADEIILAGGWKLEQYRRNPVFQNAHQYGDIIFTLGRALITEVRSGPAGEPCLFQRVEFAVGANPMARIAYGLYKGRFLNAVSVGFVPLRWENGAPGSGYRRRHLEQELLEVSAVGIPANPDALQLGLKAGAVDKADLRELADLCARALDTPAPGPRPSPRSVAQPISTAAPPPHTGALGARSNEAQLLQLARALREFLRRT